MKYLSNRYSASVFRVLLVVLAMLQVSCGGRSDEDSPVASPAGPNMIVRFTLPLAINGGSPSAGNGYVDGSADENYIDVHNSCRVLFFSTGNTFIGVLDRQTVADITGTDYRQYNLCGIPPENLPSEFKIMLAANWPDMSAVDNAVVGATTIDDICHGIASQFDCPEGFAPEAAEGRLIPFYGIHLYRGISFDEGTTLLPESVTMLRALAKVEVLFDCGREEVPETVSLKGFNLKGYCAPAKVYSQDDYGQGNDWDNDYLRSLHLVSPDNNNEPGAAQRVAHMAKTEVGGVCRMTAYIPEYRNLKADGSPAADEAFIEFRLPSQSAGENPFRLYFARYSGSTSADTTQPRYNIERNNIYRFNVSLHKGKLIITARPWNYRPQPEINA
ncbi:MAG: hypothetical protein K2O33_04120 [Muribaculaceae bacterium]|nr:hypothetical protein [Muribaculaceae bacterium]